MNDKQDCSWHGALPAASDLSANWSWGEAGMMPPGGEQAVWEAHSTELQVQETRLLFGAG